MGRLMCLDVGDRRIGIALSDPLQMFASPHSVLERVGWGPDVRAIRQIFDSTGAEKIICGLPLNMDGTEGFQAAKVRQFAEQLRLNGLPVEFTDERLSTVEAEHALLEGGMRREERRTHVDKVAAAVILQRCLDKASNEKAVQGTEKEDAMTDDTGRKDPAFEEDDEDDEDYGNQIIELTDEDGVTSQFEYLTTVEHEGKLYVVLMLLDEEDGPEADDEDGEVIILEIQKDENGEDVYASVDDESITDAVFQKFLEIVDEQDGEEDE